MTPGTIVRIAAIGTGLLALVASCGSRPVQPFENLGDEARRIANPFAPAMIDIHPLTRVDRDHDGKTLIVCHIELMDEWGDTCKGRGQLRIELYRPTGTRAAGPGVQELKWEVDLGNLDRNASLYDPATRTYRLPLEGVPDWVVPTLGGPAGDGAIGGSGVPGGRARLRATFSTDGPMGEPRFLQDEYVIQ